jgi:hypothetical protein
MIRQLANGAARVASKVSSKGIAPVAMRSFSDFQKKERGDEARYFAQEEARRLAEMKAKVEAIMASENDDEKEHLTSLLTAKKEEETGFIAEYGLNDWKVALPVGIVLAIPTLSNEWLILDAETQLLAVFMLFCGTAYNQGGAMLAATLDEYRANVFSTLKKVDESMLVDIKASIAANEKVLDMEKDIASVHALIDDMAKAKAEALNHAEEHKYRDAIARKLDNLVAIEEAAVSSLRNRMLNVVKADVVNKFSTDKAVKDAALNHAMAVLSAGKSGKIGKDVVGDVYAGALKNYRETYQKQAPGSDPILQQLEKDVAAACAAPVVEAQGGNVYETHPVTA